MLLLKLFSSTHLWVFSSTLWFWGFSGSLAPHLIGTYIMENTSSLAPNRFLISQGSHVFLTNISNCWSMNSLIPKTPLASSATLSLGKLVLSPKGSKKAFSKLIYVAFFPYHGSEKWVPPIVATLNIHTVIFHWIMIMGERANDSCILLQY